MSGERAPSGITVAEKFLGLLIIIVGAILTYVTSTNPPTQPVAPFTNLFITVGILLIGLGIFILTAKTE